MRIAVIGLGVMGLNHLRVLKRISSENPRLVEEIKYIVDIDEERLNKAYKLYGGKPVKKIEEIPDNSIDLAFIATPTSTHYEIALKMIEKGVKYLFIEKPLANNIMDTIKLIEKIEENNVALTTGYIERFNPGTYSLFHEIVNGNLREPLTTLSRRIGPYSARVRDTDVIYDLGIHEIDIHLMINGKYPYSIRTYGLKNIVSSEKLHDHGWIIMNYGDKLSFIEVNRITPFKLRKLYITAKSAVGVLDYIEQKLLIYTSRYNIEVRVRREEPLYIEDLVNIYYFKEYGRGFVDQYQAFLSSYLCEKSIESSNNGNEIIVEEDQLYQSYRDYLSTGIENYRRFIETFTNVLDKIGINMF